MLLKSKIWYCTFVLTCLVLQIFVMSAESYNLVCPSQAIWKLRALVKCNSTLKYFCLYNNVEGKYVEGCNGPDWDRKGSKRIYAGDFSRGKCIQNRFQPFIFRTNGGMIDCIYRKSLCSEEGQVVYRDNSTKDDRSCRCDYKKNYAFIKNPRNLCFCIPTEEDCSCYVKFCPVNLTLSSDYSCIQSGIQEKPKCIEITKFDKTLDEKSNEKHSSLSITTSRFNMRYTTDATILFCLCIMYIFVAGGFFLAVLFDKWTCKKLQQLERFFLGNHTVGEGQLNEGEHKTIRNTDQATDEVYYLRLMHLLFRVTCPVVRMKFNHEIQPNQLRKTLDGKKAVLEKMYRKKEKIINDSQWSLLFGRVKVTSDDFDIELMINLLQTLANISVGDLYPVVTDTRGEAMLSRIKYIRNELTWSVDGKLTKNQFNLYWDELGQAVLKLVSPHISAIVNDQKKDCLMGRLLVLNPIDIDNKVLCIFIDMSENYPAMILQRLIDEYCELKKVTIEDMLRDEKHQLYHKRKKTEACCICTTELSTLTEDSSSFKCISEKQWEALYTMKESMDSHVCTANIKNCCERFVPKIISIGDLSVSKTLILNIPDILNYVMYRLYVTGFDKFLKHNQHTLYHAMETETCCKCSKLPSEKTLINKKEWNKLFMKENNSSCIVSIKDCCCQYSVRNGIRYTDIDFISLSKICHVVGPIGVLNKIEENPFVYFLKWSFDDQLLRGSLIELLNTVQDDAFRSDMLRRTSSFNCVQSNEIPAKINDAFKWISSHSRQQQTTREMFGLGKDCVKVNTMHIPTDCPLPHRTRQFTDLTTEENNFLVVVRGLTKLVYPVIQKKFTTQCSDHVLYRIYTDIYEQTNDENKRRMRKIYLTQKQREQLFSPKNLESKNLDLKLMIYILKQSTEDKGQTEYGNQLDVIETITREIMQSSRGVLNEAKFQDVMERLRKAIVHFGGELYAKKLWQLQQIRNILE